MSEQVHSRGRLAFYFLFQWSTPLVREIRKQKVLPSQSNCPQRPFGQTQLPRGSQVAVERATRQSGLELREGGTGLVDRQVGPLPMLATLHFGVSKQPRLRVRTPPSGRTLLAAITWRRRASTSGASSWLAFTNFKEKSLHKVRYSPSAFKR